LRTFRELVKSNLEENAMIENTTTANGSAAASEKSRGDDSDPQERAERIAIKVRDCLGLDSLMAMEHDDLTRVAVTTAARDITPVDEIEGMMAAHIMASHAYAMYCFKSVNRTFGDDRTRMQFMAQAGRLIALHGRQVEQLERRREVLRARAEAAERRAALARSKAEFDRKVAEIENEMDDDVLD
jgi:hypothetical protein